MSRYTGPSSITANGTVLNGVSITNGCLTITASNVTIENSKIVGLGAGCFTTIRIESTGLVVKDTEIDGLDQPCNGCTSFAHSTYALWGDEWTCLRCNFHGFTDTTLGCHKVVLEDSWMHDLLQTSESHNEDLYCGGTAGGSLLVRHNRLENQDNEVSTAFITADFSPDTNITIDDNLLDGGGFTLYGGHETAKPYGTQDANIHITNNRFMRTPEPGAFWPKGGYAGPVTSFDSASPGNLWSGNVWDDTGAPVAPGG